MTNKWILLLGTGAQIEDAADEPKKGMLKSPEVHASVLGPPYIACRSGSLLLITTRWITIR